MCNLVAPSSQQPIILLNILYNQPDSVLNFVHVRNVMLDMGSVLPKLFVQVHVERCLLAVLLSRAEIAASSCEKEAVMPASKVEKAPQRNGGCDGPCSGIIGVYLSA